MKAVAKNKKLAAALWYSRQRCSVIPVGAGEDRKRPLVAWEKYQHERATEDQIRQWWEKWPDANVAIITGPISGIMVVDADTAEAVDAVGKFLSDSMVLPTGETPRDGRHFVFKYRDGLVTRAGVLENIDVRTQGGYVLAPPSSNGKGKYRWLEGLGLHEVDPPEMPDILFDTLQQAAGVASAPPMAHNIKEKIPSSTRGGRGHCGQPDDHARPRVTTGDHNYFEKGTRDETLFHTAHCLLRGGMSNDLALQVIKILAQNCSPPFSEKEAIAKFESALKRKDKTEGNIAELVHDFVVTTSGHFLTTDVHNRLQVTTRPDKKAVVMALLRLKEKGVIEKYGSRDGCYRRVENECEPIDFTSAETETVPLWLPFGLDKMVRTMPGNIIVVAGEPDAGKTALLLNITRYNMDNFKVHYFSSEMGDTEMRVRLEKFSDIALSGWKFGAYERVDNFGDVIRPGRGNVNIIDFLEIHDNFYEIGGRMAEIHKKLNGAVAIIALQKNSNTEVGLGGFRGLEKPRLYLTMSRNNICRIVKAKNWADPLKNPNGLECRYRIHAGCNLSMSTGWARPAPKGA